MVNDHYRSYLEEQIKLVNSDEKDAVVFLASIIPKEDKDRIRVEIANEPNFVNKEHFFLGMKVRNALRMGGFFYGPHIMDAIWFSWLEKAVYLPEEEITLTDSIRERIEKYKTNIRKTQEKDQQKTS